MKKIVHLTSGHSWGDTRIFVKECESLARAGYDVTLLVTEGLGNGKKGEVEVIDVGAFTGRFERIFVSFWKVFRVAWKLQADLYHFHDPGLIPTGVLLRIIGKIVVYDVHEDVPIQILAKEYLPKPIRSTLSAIFNVYEKTCSRFFSGICTATDFITNKFIKINPNTVTIGNYPILGQLATNTPWNERNNTVIYVGSINQNRGTMEVVQSMAHTKNSVRFSLAGNYIKSENFDVLLAQLPEYKWVDYHGIVDKPTYREIIAKAKIGIITDYPIANYVDAFATKMFEYMEAGTPFICSDFPKWISFVEEHGCGIAANPFDPVEIAQKIDYLIDNPQMAQDMGKRGKEAVVNHFNWQNEEAKLLALYSKILN